MHLTEHTLRQAWHQVAAGSGLLDDAMFPPLGTSPDQYEPRADDTRSLFLVLGEDGTVRGHRSPYAEAFATRDLDQVLYLAAEEAVRELAGDAVAQSPGEGPAAGLVTRQAEMLDRINPAWGRRSCAPWPAPAATGGTSPGSPAASGRQATGCS